MQVILSKDIYGIADGMLRKHASQGDLLDVILRNKTHYICDSVFYPDSTIVVFNSQCADVLFDREEEDEQAPERYYNTYEEPEEIVSNDIFDPDEVEQ